MITTVKRQVGRLLCSLNLHDRRGVQAVPWTHDQRALVTDCERPDCGHRKFVGLIPHPHVATPTRPGPMAA